LHVPLQHAGLASTSRCVNFSYDGGLGKRHTSHVTRHTSHVTRHTSHATQMHLGRCHGGGKHRRAHASPGSQRRRNIGTAPPLDVPQQQAFPPSSSSSFAGKKAQRVGGVKEPDAVLLGVLQREERRRGGGGQLGTQKGGRCGKQKRCEKLKGANRTPAAAAGERAAAAGRHNARARPTRAESRTLWARGCTSPAPAAAPPRPASAAPGQRRTAQRIPAHLAQDRQR
jgi:hypothetical protein